MTGMGHYRSPCFLNRLDRNVWGTHMAGAFAEATAIGGLPVPAAAMTLPRPGALFSRFGIEKLNRLDLTLFAPRARMRVPEGA
jgi:hypothetical protein